MTPTGSDTTQAGNKAAGGKPTPGASGLGEALKVWGPMLLLVLAGVWVAYQYVGPPPPQRIVLATGGEGGAYHAFGRRYAEALARDGIEVELRPSAGSIANYELLRAGEVDVAFVQGGTAPDDAADFAEGVGSLYYEPLWIFHAADRQVPMVRDLAGARLQVGAPGSGTRAVAVELLAANGIDDTHATLLGDGSDAAVDALLGGEADAVFLVASPESGAVRRLMAEEGAAVRLHDVERSLSYAQVFRSLSPVVLHEGVLDLAANVPDRDVTMVAPTAALASHIDLHPALVHLLIEAAAEVHARGGLFEDVGEFPSARRMDLPPSTAADQYFTKGRSFLYRVLPFQVAAVIARLWILVLPLLTLLLPLMKVAPPLYRWRIRRRIFRWYKDLWQIEQELEAAPDDADASPYARRLATIEHEVTAVKVPLSYMEELYHLRVHLDLVRRKLQSG